MLRTPILVYVHIVSTYDLIFFFEEYGDHRDLHVLTHPFPTRRSSDLSGGAAQRNQPDQAADPPGPQPNRSTPDRGSEIQGRAASAVADARRVSGAGTADRKSTRLNSIH